MAKFLDTISVYASIPTLAKRAADDDGIKQKRGREGKYFTQNIIWGSYKTKFCNCVLIQILNK